MTVDLDRPLGVCGHCGGLNVEVDQALAYRDQMIEQLTGDVGNLERELRGKRARIKQLERDSDIARQMEPTYDSAMEVLEHWKKVLSPKARELGGKRLDMVIARLKAGYTASELMRCANGYALKPYVVDGRRTHDGPKDAWQADAELIYRDAKRVDNGLRIMERAEDLRNVLTNVETDPGPSGSLATVEGLLSPLGQAAQRLAQYGFAVFPCQPRDKRPATPNGFKDAKRDPVAIHGCWSKHPHMNIGIATGAASGIVVLDIDGDEGWDSLHALEDKHGELPTTASITTPRGGQHFYFAHPGVEVRNTAGYPGPGLDVRGDGGYVLAPPSIGPGGRPYAVDEQAPVAAMPQWLLDLLLNRQREEAGVIGPGKDWGAFISEGSSQGERDQRMTSYVGHLFSHGHDAGEVLEAAKVLNAAKVKPPLAARDLQRIVGSIARAEARKAA